MNILGKCIHTVKTSVQYDNNELKNKEKSCLCFNL